MKKWICLLLGMAFLFPVSACESEEDLGETDNIKQSSFITVENFDSYKTVDKIYFEKTLGDATLDKEYVSEGESSLRVQAYDPAVSLDQAAATEFIIPTVGDSGDFRDFSMIDEIVLDAYGLSGTDLSVAVSAVKKNNNVVVSGPEKIWSVQAGEWNELVIPVNRTVLGSMIDITWVTHVKIKISGVNPVVCLDDLRVHKASEAYLPAQITLDENEICDFEKAYQSFTYTTPSSSLQVESEIVSNPEYTTSGVRSLKIVSPYTETASILHLQFSEKLTEAANFSMLPTTSYIAYDIYKPFERAWTNMSFTFRSGTSGAYKNVSANLPAGIGWHTVCIPLSYAVRATSVLALNWNTVKGVPNTGEDFTFYVDNVRIITKDQIPTYGSVKVVE